MNRKARRAARSAGAAAAAAPPQAETADNRLRAAAVHYNEGNRHFEAGRHAAAMASYLRAIEIAPDCLEAHVNFCAVLIVQSRFADAAAHCEQILAHDPAHVAAYNHLAVARLGAGDARRALDAVRRGLKVAETPEGRSLFALCLQNLPSVPADAEMRALVVRAMTEPWGRPVDFAGHCVGLLKADGDIAACIDRAAAAWPRRLPAAELFGEAGLHAVARDAVLRCLLENARVADIELERFLTVARSALLDAAMAAADEAVDTDTLAFHAALARQCFVNEYVFAQSEEEVRQVEALKASLAAALRDDAPVPALWPVAVAAYVPLHMLADGDKLLAQTWPDSVEALLTQQLREPAEEARLRAEIPCLTPVEDEISRLVQRQYEENPYPRWVKAAPSSKPSDINTRLRNQFPHSAFRGIGTANRVDVLVAGCGTGQQLVDVAMRIVGARVLAVDLSLPSLAYAKRQTEALGLRNIEYGQADILRLGALARDFDVVDCGGVLHHLGDPCAGWRVLLGLLRPDGVMRVALYSELARRHVVAARAFAAARGLAGSPHDIRRFRQELLALPDGELAKRVARSPDFFGMSDCRDLVFHVQEHRFTLPQIKAFLAEHDLNFIGLEIGQRVLNRYSERFPDDPARTDLDLWHLYERDNPWTFSGMYQFWVQRRAAG
jgi:2-polyprenyl-3-methyl-5-hydroxy-6-metoxy-1,4-benzoquinol methylase